MKTFKEFRKELEEDVVSGLFNIGKSILGNKAVSTAYDGSQAASTIKDTSKDAIKKDPVGFAVDVASNFYFPAELGKGLSKVAQNYVLPALKGDISFNKENKPKTKRVGNITDLPSPND